MDRKPLLVAATTAAGLLLLVAGNGVCISDVRAEPETRALPPEASRLVYCTQTAQAVRDAYVAQLSSNGKCMTGALPAPITAKICEIATVYKSATKKTGRLVEVGIQPQLRCLTCADDGERKACGQEASIQVKARLSVEGAYVGTTATAGFEVELLADAKYLAEDTEIARIAVANAAAGQDGGYNLVKGVISPVMTYNSGTTLKATGELSNPAIKAAFALNVTQRCNFKSEPESFIVPIGLKSMECPLELPPEPVPVFTVDPAVEE